VLINHVLTMFIFGTVFRPNVRGFDQALDSSRDDQARWVPGYQSREIVERE
jgi:hypothetical protein